MGIFDLNSKQKVLVLALITIIFALLPTQAKKIELTNIEQVAGITEQLFVKINTQSLEIDVSKNEKIQLVLNPKNLYKSNNKTDTFSIKVYEVLEDGSRVFVSKQNITISRKFRNKSKNIYLDPGHFTTASKRIEIDIFDTDGLLTNTYATTIVGSNLETQSLDLAQALEAADCDNSEFGTCQLEYIMKNINFIAKPNNKAKTFTSKNVDGTYNVTLPMRKFTKSNVNKIITRTTKQVIRNVKTDFGEAVRTSEILLGDISRDYAHINYDTVSQELSLNSTNGVTIDGGLKLAAKPLSQREEDGLFEYDGNNLYFNKQGVRQQVVLGGSDVKIQTSGGSTTVISGGSSATELNGDVIAESLVLKASLVTTVSNSENVSVATDKSIMRFEGNAGAVTGVTLNTAGIADGRMIIIKGTSDTNTVRLDDSAAAANGILQLHNDQDMTLYKGQTITLIYDAFDGAWLELSRSQN